MDLFGGCSHSIEHWAGERVSRVNKISNDQDDEKLACRCREKSNDDDDDDDDDIVVGDEESGQWAGSPVQWQYLER